MKRIYYLYTLLLFVSCQKAPEFDLGSVFPEAIGSWQWEYTGFPEDGLDDIYSDTVHYQMNINESGEIEMLKNNFTIDKLFIESFISKSDVIKNGDLWVLYELNTKSNFTWEKDKPFNKFRVLHRLEDDQVAIYYYPFVIEYPENWNGSIVPLNVYKRIE